MGFAPLPHLLRTFVVLKCLFFAFLKIPLREKNVYVGIKKVHITAKVIVRTALCSPFPTSHCAEARAG